MSETTATRTPARIAEAAALAAIVAAWAVGAVLLARTSVPPLHLAGLDQHRFFDAALLRRARRFTTGEDVLWLLRTLAVLAALGVLAWRLPRSVPGMRLGRIGSAIVVAMVLLVTTWLVALPFGIAELAWEHHYGLGPFDVGAWLSSQWAGLGPQAVAILVGVLLVVGLAGRFERWWWLPAGAAIVALVAALAFVSGYLSAAGTHSLPPSLRADAARLARVERVSGTPVRVQDVSSRTEQANAMTEGFGPSTRVVVWDTMLDGRFSRAQIDVVIAHELGHVRSRHIPKAIGWSALTVLPTLFVVAAVTRRRGGLGDPANLPLALLVLALLALVTLPLQNLVSRRYEAEADWRALNATHDPVAAQRLFQGFARTSLEQPDPPLLGYLWLENHPTLMQRIAMTRAWARRH
ncbi:MAG TPA: M48 family metalloprotease [Gaiellaceae bacterium]|nr:M48 family metalloprotease [Gaiellaceae bacterium]